MFAYAAILTLLASVSAQSTGTQASALDIAAVQAHFTRKLAYAYDRSMMLTVI
jgi:hypothetical protein